MTAIQAIHTREPRASQVYISIANITAALSKEGIAKGRKNQQQGYAFRGIDDVYLALAPLLASEKLCIIPRVRERLVTERETKAGGVMFSVTVLVDFDLVSAVDGSTHTATLYGEAMDSGDKATNKAMSAAYKYMALEVFCIPTEGENDADATTHEVVPRQIEQPNRGLTESGEITLPGTAKSWDGWGSKPLGLVPLDVLAKARKWLHDKDATKNALLVTAMDEEAERRRQAEATAA